MRKKPLILIVNINNYLQLCVTTTYVYKDTSHFSEEAACETARVYLNRYCLLLLLNIYDGTVVFSDSINAILQRHWWIRNCSLSHPTEEGDFLLISWVGLPWKAWVGDFVFFILKWIGHAEVIMLSVMWFCDETYWFFCIIISDRHLRLTIILAWHLQLLQQYWWKRIKELSDAKHHYFYFM